MKKLKSLWTLMALPLIAACSSDDLVKTDPGKIIPEGEGLYITVNFAPYNKGTRSYTNGDNSSDGGVEEGSDVENKVKKALIVLATESNAYVAHGEAENDLLASSSNNTINYQASAKIEKTNIKSFYELPEVKAWIAANQADGAIANPPVNVFIYCNAPESLKQRFEALNVGDTGWTDWTYQLSGAANEKDNTLWTDNGFLMTNVSLATRYFPSTYSTWSSFSTSNNAFDLSGWNNRNQSTSVDNSSTNGNGGGTINVHRMAARFDFRDGSQGIGDAAPSGNGIDGEAFTYSMMENEESKTIVKAKLITMSLVNMNKEQYYLERTATGSTVEDWTTPYSNSFTSGFNLLEPEKAWYSNATGGDLPDNAKGNWVVTPKAGNRTGAALKEANNFATYYKYPFFAPTGVVANRGTGWDIYNVADVVGGTKDYKDTGNYHIWRYLTENTVADGEDDQMNGNSTGIVFKVQLLPDENLNNPNNYWDRLLYNALKDNTDGPVLFAFSNNLFCSWHQVQYAALKSAGYNANTTEQKLDRTGTFYKAVFGTGGAGTLTITKEDGTTVVFTDDLAEDPDSPNALHVAVHHDDETDGSGVTTEGPEWIAFRDATVANTFTIYEKFNDGTEDAPNWGYFCYYYYWNRHNDNGDNDAMGPMEFAVVRNNVYKLAVISLKKLGHPRIPENDPDDPKPDTPDEKSDVYITVSVQVLPWVVRQNDIVFE